VGRNMPNSAPPKTHASTITLMAMELIVRLSFEVSRPTFPYNMSARMRVSCCSGGFQNEF
jgi:hypothetical protein